MPAMSPFQVSISLSGHVVAIQMPLTDESMLAAAASNENVFCMEIQSFN